MKSSWHVIYLITLIMLFSIFGCKAQDFHLFDEEVSGNTILVIIGVLLSVAYWVIVK